MVLSDNIKIFYVVKATWTGFIPVKNSRIQSEYIVFNQENNY